jgi:hypothetical protein
MKQEHPFKKIIDAYKHHLRASKGDYKSFESFCGAYNVRTRSVRQWMVRHCISISSILYEVMLEKYLEDPTNNCFPELRRKKSKDTGTDVKRMEGVVITFPDGVVVRVKKSTPENVNRLIEQYNNKNTNDNVWAE